ncbi:MAG: hypothetical protein QM820_42275 [Minicystis sp.]
MAAALQRREEDVVRLEIPVRHAGRVGGVEPGGDALEDGHGLAHAEPLLAIEQLRQRHALEQLHDAVGPLVGQHPEREDVDDVAVPDAVHRARLGDEPRHHARVRRELPVQHLDRHPLPDERLLPGVHGPERPGPEPLVDPVLAHHEPGLQPRVVGG